MVSCELQLLDIEHIIDLSTSEEARVALSLPQQISFNPEGAVIANSNVFANDESHSDHTYPLYRKVRFDEGIRGYDIEVAWVS